MVLVSRNSPWNTRDDVKIPLIIKKIPVIMIKIPVIMIKIPLIMIKIPVARRRRRLACFWLQMLPSRDAHQVHPEVKKKHFNK